MSVRIWSRQRGFIFMLIVAAVAFTACGLPALADEPEPAGPAGVTASPGATKGIRVQFSGGPITDVLRVIGKASGADIMIGVGPGVEGTIPAFTLTYVTVEEALDYLKAAGYIQWHKQGNLYIVTAGPAPVPQGPSEEAKPTVGEGLSVISVKVALLSELWPLADPQDYHSRIRQVLEGPFYSGMPPQVTGDRIIHDPNAGLVTIINPDMRLPARLFRPARLSYSYGTGGRRPGSLAEEHGSVKIGEERSFDLVWPPGRPQYYLEKVEQDLYRRVAVADKEGYTVAVRPTGAAPDFTVELKMARNTFTRGKYDETIRAFVGQPSLLKTVLTSQAPLSTGQQTLLVWLPRPEPQVVATVAGAAPSWAVGWWELSSPRHFLGIVNVLADGSVTMEGERTTATGTGSIDPSGRLYYRRTDAGTVLTITGKLYPNGSGAGTSRQDIGDMTDTLTWTATKGGGPEAAQGAPSWAVGEWKLNTSEGAAGGMMSVLPDGTITIKDPESAEGKAEPGTGSVDPSGQLTYKASELGLTMTMTGRLRPDGTGSGTGHGEGGPAGEGQDFTWTATQISRPMPPPPEPVRAGLGAPSWAVGEWEMTGPGEETGLLTVKADGSVLWTSGTNRREPPGEPHIMYGPGSIDSIGQVKVKATLGGEGWTQEITLTGKLNPDGTATGGLSPPGVAWTATKVTGPATEPGAPAWAVGQWYIELVVPVGWVFVADVLPDGTVLAQEHSSQTGKGTIDPSGQIQYRVTRWVANGKEYAATLIGKLTPEGTGGGLIREEGGTQEFGVFWTARQTLQLIAHTEPPVSAKPKRALPWAVGNWTIMSKLGYVQEDHSLGDYTIAETRILMAVRPDGSIAGGWTAYDAGLRLGTIDSSGRVALSLYHGGDLAETLTGVLNADGTGSGTTRLPNRQDIAGTWTAIREGRTDIEPATAPGPAGVAVLLEVGPADEVPEIPSQ